MHRTILKKAILFTLTLLLSAIWLFIVVAVWGRGRILWGTTLLLPKTGFLPFSEQHPAQHILIDFVDRLKSTGSVSTLCIYLTLTGLPCVGYTLTALLPDTLRTLFPKRKAIRIVYWCVAMSALLFAVFCAFGGCSTLLQHYKTLALYRFLVHANYDMILFGSGLSVIGWLLPCLIVRSIRAFREHNALKLIDSGLKRSALAIVCAFVITMISALLLAILKPYDKQSVNAVSSIVTESANNAASFFTLVAMAPFMEELAFRGLIQRSLRRSVPAWVAILLTALFFGLWHRNLGQFIYTFIFAIPVGWIYEHTGKLRYTMLMHACMNLVSTLCYSGTDRAIVGRLYVFPRIRETLMGFPIWAAALLIPVLVATLYVLICMFRDGPFCLFPRAKRRGSEANK